MAKQKFWMRTWDCRDERIPEWVEHEYNDQDPLSRAFKADLEGLKAGHVLMIERYVRGEAPFVEFQPLNAPE